MKKFTGEDFSQYQHAMACADVANKKLAELTKDYEDKITQLEKENAELKDLQHKRWEQGWANAVKVWKPANDKLTAQLAIATEALEHEKNINVKLGLRSLTIDKALASIKDAK